MLQNFGLISEILWSCLNIRFKQHQYKNISTGIISVRHTLLPVPCFLFIQSVVSVETEAWSSTRLQDASLPSSLPLFSPSSIYPLHLAACQTALCHWPFAPDTHNLCFSISILPSWYMPLSSFPSLTPLFPIHFLFSLSLSLFSSLHALCAKSSFCEAFKNRSC